MSQEPPAPQMDFFAEPKSDVYRNLKKLATPVGFADLTQNDFARLAKDNLRYFIERELPAHVGGASTCCVFIQCSSCIMSMNTSAQIQIMQLLEPLVSALNIQQRIMGSVSAS